MKHLRIVILLIFNLSYETVFSQECASYLQSTLNANEKFKLLRASDSTGVNYSQSMFYILNQVFIPFVNDIIQGLDSGASETSYENGQNYKQKILEYFKKVRFNRSNPIVSPKLNSEYDLNLFYEELERSSEKLLGRSLYPFEKKLISKLAEVSIYNVKKNKGIWDQEELQKSTFENIVWTYSHNPGKKHDFHFFLETSITPVGFYGLQTAESMHLTTQILIQMILENKELSDQIFEDNRDIFEANSIARSKNSEDVNIAATMAMVEGVVSLNQVLSALMVHQVPGSRTGYQAIQNIVFNSASARGLVTELTLKLPMGLLGPLVISGHGFYKPTVKNSEGKLELSKGITEQLKILKDRSRSKLNPNTRSSGAAGVGCPMSICNSINSKSGLQNLAELYFKVFEVVHHQLTSDHTGNNLTVHKLKHPEEIFSNPNIDMAIEDLKTLYPDLIRNYFDTKFNEYTRINDLEKIRSLLQHKEFNLSVLTILNSLEGKKYFFEVLMIYFDSLPSGLDGYELQKTLEAISRHLQIDGFDMIVNNSFLISSIVDQLEVANANKSYNDTILQLVRMIYNTQDPNKYISNFYHSDLWSKLSEIDRAGFVYSLIYNNHDDVIFNDDILEIFKIFVNHINSTNRRSIFHLVVSINNQQLLDYFLSLENLDINLKDVSGNSAIFTVFSDQTSSYVVFKKFINDKRLLLDQKNNQGHNILEFLIQNHRQDWINEVLKLRQFPKELIVEAIQMAEQRKDFRLSSFLRSYLNQD